MTEQNANTTVRYSDADLNEFRELIEKKVEKAREELNYLQEQILEITENSGDDHGGDWMDDSSINNDIEFLNNMAIRQRKYIQDLENALVRIKNKSYGICIVTGQLIDKRRLIAVPTATKSVEAKNAEALKTEKLIDKKQETSPELLEKLEKVEVPATPKIITKVIRKPKSPPAKPVNVDEEDDVLFDELDKNYPYDSDDDDSGDDDLDMDKDPGGDQKEEYDDESSYNY
jgi:RNA polymerase-binding transcription factor DksA